MTYNLAYNLMIIIRNNNNSNKLDIIIYRRYIKTLKY